MNNLVVMERADGKFQHLPYSVDISLGQDWYPTVELAGQNSVAQGCQSDPQCWDDTIATCETLVANFIAANPIAMLNQIYSDLSNREMLRNGDEGRYRQLVSYLERRMNELPAELELNREEPYYNYCGYPLIECGGYCMYPEECYVCGPEPFPLPEPEPFPGEEGEAEDDEPAGDELVAEAEEDQGGAGGASGFVGAAGSAMAGVDDEEAQYVVVRPVPGGGIAVPPPIGAGGGACLPPIDYYDPPIFMEPRPF